MLMVCKCIFRGLASSILLTLLNIERSDLLIVSLFMKIRAVPIAMDRAIKEIVSGIVQRSVSIATQTTKELVLKVSISMKFNDRFLVLISHVFILAKEKNPCFF